MKNTIRRKIYSFLLAGTITTNIVYTNPEKIAEEPDEFYFEYNRNEFDFESLEDIILTYEEEGKVLSDEAKRCINNIFNIENENANTEYFKITEENVEKQYIEYSKQDNYIDHFYNNLYDSSTNQILWDKVPNIIWCNSIKENYLDYKSLSYTEIKYITLLFEKYLTDLQKDYPKIDILEIACKLENLSLYYTIDKLGQFAETTSKYIVYYDSDQNIRKFDPNNSTSIHEFFHLICFSCDCDYDKKYEINGLDLVPSDAIKLENKDIYGLYYTFYEEASAERVMHHYTNNLPVVYSNYQKIIDNIEFVLSLNNNYKLDSYVESCLYKEPIKFIRMFPTGYTNTRENFTDNVRMLVIYDTLLRYGYPNDKVVSYIFNKYNTPEEIDKSLIDLINYSQTQLTKLFFSNMIVLNEEHKDNYDLTYYIYLVNIFESRMEQANRLLLMDWNLNNYNNLLTKQFEEYFELMKNEYISYLEKYYHDKSIKWQFTINDDITIIDCFPTYVSEAKSSLYKKLESELEIDVMCKPRKLTLKQ